MDDNQLKEIFALCDCGDYYLLFKKASPLFKEGDYKYQIVKALTGLIKESVEDLYKIALLDDNKKINNERKK